MNRLIANTMTCTLIGLLSMPTMAQNAAEKPAISPTQAVLAHGKRWIGTWATAPQPFMPGSLQRFRNQSLRLIVHTSAGGTKVRIKISNTFGDHPLLIGGAHIVRRTAAAGIDPTSDRTLMFHGRSSTTVPARSMVVSDPAELDVPALSDLAISLFLPKTTEATTLHILAMQTSYVSSDTGDSTADVKFPVAKTIRSWPFLTGVDVAASAHGAAIVAFGSSLTDGDGSTLDTNRRWPDVLAERLQKGADGMTEVGVLNQGIIGNRLLDDSPRRARSPFGAALGQAGLARFKRDVLAQAGVGYVIVGLGINDIVFPGSLTPLTERMNAESMISGLRRTPRTSVKMAALAPMPSASVSTTVTASPWVRASERTATLRSLTNDIILLFFPEAVFQAMEATMSFAVLPHLSELMSKIGMQLAIQPYRSI